MTNPYFGKAYRGDPAANYERFFVPAIGAPLATDLIHLAELRPGERVLDIACGTGVVARLASQQVGATGTVAGLDVNPGMPAPEEFLWQYVHSTPIAGAPWRRWMTNIAPLWSATFSQGGRNS